MKLIKNWAEFPTSLKNSAIAIGNFDGIHIGHQKLISIAKNLAAEQNIPWGILTFEPHPRQFFAPNSKPFRITPLKEKARILKNMGADFLCAAPFNKEFASLSGRDFIKETLIKSLAAKHIICGEDFQFGNKKSGSIIDLKSNKNFQTHIAKEIKNSNNTRYSSSLIRNAIEAGEMETAQKMLGRSFEIEGKIIKGNQYGRKLGFPTANLKLGDYIRPKYGIYAIKATPAETSPNTPKIWHNGVANLGIRPTIGDNQELLEAHLFNFNQEIYNQNWRIKLKKYIRKEQSFNTQKELRNAIKQDCKKAQNIINQNK